jgi:hypothetical protein
VCRIDVRAAASHSAYRLLDSEVYYQSEAVALGRDPGGLQVSDHGPCELDDSRASCERERPTRCGHPIYWTNDPKDDVHSSALATALFLGAKRATMHERVHASIAGSTSLDA